MNSGSRPHCSVFLVCVGPTFQMRTSRLKPDNKKLAESCVIQKGSEQRYWSNQRTSLSSSRGVSRPHSSRSSLPSIDEEKSGETENGSEEDAAQQQAAEV